MKNWFIIGSGGVLGIWLVTILTLFPSVEGRLNAAARDVLQSTVHGGIFKDVTVTFSGQGATLTGEVEYDHDSSQAEQLIIQGLRNHPLLKTSLNPVVAVHNKLSVRSVVSPYNLKPWIMAARYGDQLQLSGVVTSDDFSQKLIAAFLAKSKPADLSLVNSIQVMPRIVSTAEWNAEVLDVPVLQMMGNEKAVIALTQADGNWKLMPAATTTPDLVSLLKDANPQSQTLDSGLKELRSWVTEEAEKRRVAEASPTPPMKPSTPATPDLFPPLSTSAYIGWFTDGKTVQLFGKVPSQFYKQAVIQNAITSFPGMSLNSARLIINEKTTLQEQGEVKFQTFSQPTRPRIGIIAPGYNSKVYPTDVYDSEIIYDFPEVAFAEGELSGHLASFRSNLVKSGELALEFPYLSLLWKAGILTLSGEVDSPAAHDSVLNAIANAYPHLKLVDKLSVTPLVKPVSELDSTLASMPVIPGNSTGVATTRPGQPWRSSVVHAVYFNTGSDRSKDQERALYQIRRLLAANSAARLDVIGHTDNVGAEESNVMLSRERAEKFVHYLATNGIDPAILTSSGAGSSSPVADNTKEEGKALNRRVDVILK